MTTEIVIVPEQVELVESCLDVKQAVRGCLDYVRKPKTPEEISARIEKDFGYKISAQEVEKILLDKNSFYNTSEVVKTPKGYILQHKTEQCRERDSMFSGIKEVLESMDERELILTLHSAIGLMKKRPLNKIKKDTERALMAVMYTNLIKILQQELADNATQELEMTK